MPPAPRTRCIDPYIAECWKRSSMRRSSPWWRRWTHSKSTHLFLAHLRQGSSYQKSAPECAQDLNQNSEHKCNLNCWFQALSNCAPLPHSQLNKSRQLTCHEYVRHGLAFHERPEPEESVGQVEYRQSPFSGKTKNGGVTTKWSTLEGSTRPKLPVQNARRNQFSRRGGVHTSSQKIPRSQSQSQKIPKNPKNFGMNWDHQKFWDFLGLFGIIPKKKFHPKKSQTF